MAGGQSGAAGSGDNPSPRGHESSASSVEVRAPVSVPPLCSERTPCLACVMEKFAKARGEKGMPTKQERRCGCRSFGSAPSMDSTKTPSYSPSSYASSSGPSMSVSFYGVPEGMESDMWGGIDRETTARCRHRKHPRRLVCWDGPNTGRRYLGCAVSGKENMCDFVLWIDEKWPLAFQEVASSLWDVVGNFKKKADEAQVDLLASIQLRNDLHEEKEALAKEKEDLLCEKKRLQMELSNRAKRDADEKKIVFAVILGLVAVMVAVVLAVMFKKK